MTAPESPEPVAASDHDFFENRLPFLIVGGAGVVFCLIGIFMSWSAIAFISRSIKVEGRVTGVESVDDSSVAGRTRTLYYPIVEFTDASGETRHFRGDVSRSRSDGALFRRSGWNEGERVGVRYDPANPDHARLAGGWSILPHLFLVLGAGAIWAAWAAARAMRRGAN